MKGAQREIVKEGGVYFVEILFLFSEQGGNETVDLLLWKYQIFPNSSKKKEIKFDLFKGGKCYNLIHLY